MNLAQRQQLFVQLVARFILLVYEQHGFTLTFGDASRMDGLGHVKGSFHYKRLAVDLNLFINGIYQLDTGPQYRLLGAMWKSLHPDCTWGGNFKSANGKGDYNHFSLGER